MLNPFSGGRQLIASREHPSQLANEGVILEGPVSQKGGENVECQGKIFNSVMCLSHPVPEYDPVRGRVSRESESSRVESRSLAG